MRCETHPSRVVTKSRQRIIRLPFAKEASMPKILAVITELLILICAMWLLSFLSTFLHEMGHAVGYMLATGDRRWHIRVGWGKRLLHTEALTVNLFVFDGLFIPSGQGLDTREKRIATLSGGPAVSLLLVLGLSFLKFSGFSFPSDILADGVMEFLLHFSFFLNLWILLLSLAPIHYFHGQVKGLETDGLQILHAMKKDGH